MSYKLGKARGLRIDAKFPDDPKGNLNPHSESFRIYGRVQKQATQAKHSQTRILHKLRKLNKQLNAIKRKDYFNVRSQLFGYWYYWFKEGKIGPDSEDNEAQLLAARYTMNEKKMEHLLDKL